jgi:hypothetical protein
VGEPLNLRLSKQRQPLPAMSLLLHSLSRTGRYIIAPKVSMIKALSERRQPPILACICFFMIVILWANCRVMFHAFFFHLPPISFSKILSSDIQQLVSALRRVCDDQGWMAVYAPPLMYADHHVDHDASSSSDQYLKLHQENSSDWKFLVNIQRLHRTSRYNGKLGSIGKG